jgi:uncharacterized protein YndB with AHSA1/START domain
METRRSWTGARHLRRAAVAVVAAAGIAGAAAAAVADVKEARTGAFVVEHSVTLPGSPEAIFDAITGDISGWWDHTFSGKPRRLFIEARPGGGFWEHFDDEGNGVKHATVTYAHRGRLLRFEGPLGLSGNAITLVTSYAFTAVGSDSTRLDVSSHCAGEFQEEWPAVVDGVWKHFIVDRFQSWILSGRHLKK